MAVDRLSIYNNALGILGQRALTSEFQNSPDRKALDEFWALNIVNHCLELAKPKFALETAKLGSPVVSSATSFDSVYTLPTDYVCIVGVFSDEALQVPITRYLLGNGTIATEVATNIYLRYICSSRLYSQWTAGFSRLVPAYLANEASQRIAPNKSADAFKAFNDHLNVTIEVEGVKESDPRPIKSLNVIDASYLRVYNGVAQLLGRDPIVSTDDQSALRVAIDYVVGPSGGLSGSMALNAALQLSRPRFAVTTLTLDAGVPGTEHGYTYVHTLPSGFISLIGLYSDTNMDVPVNRFFQDADTLATDYESVVLRYLAAVTDPNKWSPGFFQFFCAHIALALAPTQLEADSATALNTSLQALKLIHDERLSFIREHESIAEPMVRPAAPEFVLTEDLRGIYNRALAILKLPPILTISDDSQRRHALDSQMNTNLVTTRLSAIAWNFACVREELTPDGSYTETLGWQYRYDLPAAFLRMDNIFSDDNFRCKAEFLREGNYIYSNEPTLYIRYVTSDMVTTPQSWPQYFRDHISAELAVLCCGLPGADAAEAARRQDRYFREATNTDAEHNSPPPRNRGSWANSRGYGYRGPRLEGGYYRR